MKLVIISNYWHFVNEKSSSRYNSLAEIAIESGLDVTVMTSTFYHTKKIQRDYEIKAPCNTVLVDEPSYQKNVTPKRIAAHATFAKGVITTLEQMEEKPDVIYLFVPPTGLAKKVVTFAKKNGIRVIIDVLDLWPEAFAMLMPGIAAKVLLGSMKRSVEFAYANADEVIAVSQAYVDRALRHNTRQDIGHSVFIGTDLAFFDACAHNAQPLEGKLRPVTMAYIGMLGHSYDLCGVMDAMALRIKEGHDDVELLVMGDGPLREKFENYAKELALPVRFTGRLPYEEMVQKLVQCDIGLNVLVGKAEQSIINKHADYVSAGIPIINVQKNQEFGHLLADYNAGVMCNPGDVRALADAISELAGEETKRKEMGKNSRRLAEEKFDRRKTYQEIISVIKGE